MEFESKQILVPLDGLPMAKNCSLVRFREATQYVPKEGDVFVASYHKSGTTWVQYMVWELANEAKEPPYVHEMMLDYGQRVEQLGGRAFNKKPDEFVRHFKTHLPFGYMPFNDQAKYIYVTRNPWDVCVSYYNMLKQMPQFYGFKDGTFDDFFKDFIAGHNDCGSYFDHLVDWLANVGKPNILFLKYEDMKNDHKGTVIKIANFLGKGYKESAENEAILEKVMYHTSFDYMKTLPFVLPASFEVIQRTGRINVGKNLELVDTGDYKSIDFFKVGKSGYAKVLFNDEQKAVMNATIESKFAAFPDLIKEWKQA